MEIELFETKEVMVEQRSEEWFLLRMERLTASLFPKLMPSTKQKINDWNKTQEDILIRIASQILTGERKELKQSESMQRGTIKEDDSIIALEGKIMKTIRPSGFWIISDNIGDSPDGIIEASREVVEGKCPDSHTHLKYYNDKDLLWKEYKWQCNGHLLGTGFDSGYLYSFDDRFPLKKQIVVRPFERVKSDMDLLEERLDLAVKKMLGYVYG